MNSSAPARASSGWRVPLGVAVVTFGVFSASLAAGFVNWDDGQNFLENPHYRGLGFANLKWMFSDFYGHYIPLTWLTLGLDYVLWGMNPAGYHFTNLLLHAANAAAFCLLLQALLSKARPDSDPRDLAWASAAGALFFSIHPLRVESVAWITERRDLTSGLFFILALTTYLRMTEAAPGTSARRKWLALSLASFAASILCKATGMMLPFVLLLLDAWPLRRFQAETRSALLREKLPFIALMIAALVLTALGQRHARALQTVGEYPLLQSLAQPGYRVSFYVLKTLLPVRLSPMYLFRPDIGAVQLIGWIAVLAITAGVVVRRRGMPAAVVSWLAYAALIAPVAGFLQAGRHYAADRYTYLPCLPFAALVSAGMVAGFGRLPRPLLLGAAACGLAALAALSALQTRIWNNSIALWDQAILVDDRCWPAYLNRAEAKHAAGDLSGALADYTRCLDLEPGQVMATANRGSVRFELGDPKTAIDDYTRAIGLQADYVKAWNLRGLARERLGDREGARADYDEALRIQPSYPLARSNRGFLRRNQGDLDGALEDAETALRADPSSGPAYILRASVFRARGRLDAAMSDLDRAVLLLPRSVEAFNNRALIFMQTGRIREAYADYDRAVSLSPGNPAVLTGRAQARYLLGDRPGAAADLQAALQRAPKTWPQRADAEALLQKALQPN